MFFIYLKIIAALATCAIIAIGVALMSSIWEKDVRPSLQAQRALNEIGEAVTPGRDLSVTKFNDALGMLQQDRISEALVILREINNIYRDGVRYRDARRVLGEYNMDVLLSRDPMPGKKEYIVQRGDSLLKIASNQDCTLDYIMQVNGRYGTSLQPGDQLIVASLKGFEIFINTKENTLELRKNGSFFKEYQLEGHKFPPGTRAEFDDQIISKTASLDGRALPVGDRRQVMADKSMSCKRPGVGFYWLDPEKAGRQSYQLGFYLKRHDLEELLVVVRVGTPVYVRKG